MSQHICTSIPTLQDIETAAVRLNNTVVRTPFLFSETLSKQLNTTLYLKFENLQFTASFKERGALNKLLSLSTEEKEKGVITASAGNHAQGLAYHAQKTQSNATIIMPENTPNIKVQRVKEFGANVILHGKNFNEAALEMQRLAIEKKMTIVHPFDDPDIIAGQGTIALEILNDRPDIDTLIVPVGGGGLISGIAIAAKAIRPDIKIVGVQTAAYSEIARCFGKQNIPVGATSTVAEGIAVSQPGQLTQQIINQYVDDILIVDEDTLEEAIALLLNVEKTVCEGAGAIGIGALMAYPQYFTGRQVGVILSGGNIDTRVMIAVLQRHLTRTGRIVRIRVELPDNPGALARLTAIIAEYNGNIYELRHERFAAASRAKESAVSVDIELKSASDLDILLNALTQEKYVVKKEYL
ncbi:MULTISPECIES: threonine ammonia-lyase [Acinetobacter]|uniref:Threonine ammonia-lyase n=1 Tax=Acinetobacter populi TaxID=1582270 RepID=A0A1Z9YUK3_9GAMM|nr:threonine ammonia-lyase [Acinetobacter populi]OUY05898.1 threonine ammonia-lyase [Acinetobacter populi]